MIDVKVLKKLVECINFIRDNLNPDNYTFVYEIACHRYGTSVVCAAELVLLVALYEVKKNG